jgi:hypothetical protein
VLLQEQPVVVLLVEGVLVSWSLAMDERGEHEDLRGSGRRSVIPYVHRKTRVVLLNPALSEPFLFSTAGLDRPIFPVPCEEVPTRSFYSSRTGSYNETRGPTGGPEVVETLYNI